MEVTNLVLEIKQVERKTIIVIFCISESVALIIPNVAKVFKKLINEELKEAGIQRCILQKVQTSNP